MLCNFASRLLITRFVALLPLCLLLLPSMAWAQESVGTIITNTSGQFRWLIPLISAVSYIGGTAMIIQVLNSAIDYSAAPGQKVKMTGLIARTFGASALFQLPSVIGVLQSSVFKETNAFAYNKKLEAVNGEGLDSALVSMVMDLLPALAIGLNLIAFLSGMFMIIGGISALANYQYQQDNVSKKGIAVRLGIGTALITFAPLVKTVLQTVFSTSTASAVSTLAYDRVGMAAADAARVDNVFNAIFVWLGMIGLIAILRGLWVLYGSLEGKGGPGSLMAPMTHLIAGAALVNIAPAIKMVEATLGCGPGSSCAILT